MKKYYKISGRYVVVFDIQNGKLDFINKEVRRFCPSENGFYALERDPKSPGNAFYQLDPSCSKWVSSSIQPLHLFDFKYPEMLVYSSLFLVISGNLLQVFAFDIQQWFRFTLVIVDGTIEALLIT